MTDRLKIFESKIEEYYLSCMPSLNAFPDKSFLKDWPFYKFSINRLNDHLAARSPDSLHGAIADKLVDIKLHLAYLLTVNDHFLRGPTLIVGNNEIHKLNPNTISALRGIHYRVYLLSVLIEQVLDLLCLVIEGRPSNCKKGKWGKIILVVQGDSGQAIISDADAALIERFKAQVRTAELHKYSMVRALTGKEKWTHLQEEEEAVTRILANLYSRYSD